MDVSKASSRDVNSSTNLKPNKPRAKYFFVLPILTLAVIIALTTIAFVKNREKITSSLLNSNILPQPKNLDFTTFKTDQEFKEYLAKGQDQTGYGLGDSRAFTTQAELRPDGNIDAKELQAPEGAAAPERISETNVQVKGIDEPDILKTDGNNIYYSKENNVFFPPVFRLTPINDKDIGAMPAPGRSSSQTISLKAFPPADLAKQGEIPTAGDLLLTKNTLVVFNNENKIIGYNVSDPAQPSEKWQIELADNSYLVNSRLFDNKIYFVTQNRILYDNPCPIKPLTNLEVACTDIYRPDVNIPADVTFHAFVLDPQNGEITKDISFVGSSGQSIIYLSAQSLYATYTYMEDIITYLYEFYNQDAKDLVPDSLLQKLAKIKEYDLSNQAKMVEYSTLWEEYLSSLNDNKRLEINTEVSNRMTNYAQSHARELEKTGLVKISLDDFTITASGSVPGQPLNQFSLDEYEKHLRIATTVGSSFMFGSSQTANDIYVLDNNLNITGSVQDLGQGERIYSARFIGNKGYLVTFKQIDPFFVLDLANPKKPAVKGELKIPGYSSYLHPIDDDIVLGIGREEQKVKLSMFDVSSAENPIEVDKYLLDEYFSEAVDNHHAFLLDDRHEIFFLPGSKGGYIFSYAGNKLALVKAIANIQPRRALYLDDYLYIAGDNKIIVLDEANWEQINQLDLN